MKTYRTLMWCERKEPYYTFELEWMITTISSEEAERISLHQAKEDYPTFDIEIIKGETFVLDE